MKSPKDPVDHSRTTRPHAGESMTDTKNMPALIVIGLALVCSSGHWQPSRPVTTTPAWRSPRLPPLVLVVGMLWLAIEHRRVRGIEERWYAEHPEAHRQRPSS